MFYTQSGVHILYLVRILYPVRSPWFAVRSPCFILTGIQNAFLCGLIEVKQKNTAIYYVRLWSHPNFPSFPYVIHQSIDKACDMLCEIAPSQENGMDRIIRKINNTSKENNISYACLAFYTVYLSIFLLLLF